MARIVEPTAEELAEWNAWVAERPDPVRIVAERFDPWSLYRMKSTGHRVVVHGFNEELGQPVTLTVDVLAEFNLLLHERQVFGIDPNDLDPCDLPGPDEPKGAMLTQGEVIDNLDAMRVAVRPDLWEMGPDGKASRRDDA